MRLPPGSQPRGRSIFRGFCAWRLAFPCAGGGRLDLRRGAGAGGFRGDGRPWLAMTTEGAFYPFRAGFPSSRAAPSGTRKYPAGNDRGNFRGRGDQPDMVIRQYGINRPASNRGHEPAGGDRNGILSEESSPRLSFHRPSIWKPSPSHSRSWLFPKLCP